MTRSSLLLLVLAAECFFLVPCSCTVNQTTEIIRRTLPAYTILSNAHLLNSTRCGRELDDFREAIDRRLLWSLKVLDSSGEPRPGFLYGNNFWLGSRSQCEDASNRNAFMLMREELVNNSKYRNVEEEYPPFQFSYFVAYFRHNSTVQYHVRLPNEDLVTLGLCLPASCSSYQLATVLQQIFRNRSLIVSDLYAADFKLVEVTDLNDDHQWLLSSSFIIVMFVLGLTCLLILMGTVYDVLIHQKCLKRRKKLLSCENNNTTEAIDAKETHEDPEDHLTSLKPQGLLGRTLQAFSIYSNTAIIFDTTLGADSIAVIHGLRFLGMLWIIMVHTTFYMADYANNKAWAWRKGEGFSAQIVSNATLSVDTFFFLSGFLITHLYLLSRQGKSERLPFDYAAKAKSFFLGVVKRFIRLTPAYMMAIGVSEVNSMWYSKTSQFYMSERPHVVCPKYWWRNILYIQNFFGRDDMCLSWSWYLANDMQFFVIGTFLLALSSMYFKVTASILALMLISSTIITGYISYIYNYVPTMDQQFHLLEILYDPPWTRIGPYIIGMVTGFIVIRLGNKLRLKRRTVILFWILGSACNLLVLFGLSERQIPLITSAIYSALSRTGWAIGIAWILIACCTNHGGIVNKILSFRGWIPLSRLTYCAYLLNPMLINSVFLYHEASMHIDFITNGALFLGIFVISYCSAYVFSLMFETPYVLLMRQIVSAIEKKK